MAGLIEAGADIVAFDATDRPRHHDREDILRAILNAKALAMAVSPYRRSEIDNSLCILKYSVSYITPLPRALLCLYKLDFSIY